MAANLRRDRNIFWAICLTFAFSWNASAEIVLTDQLEALRSSLPANDPARREIGLRLADAYFANQSEANQKLELGDKSLNRTETERKLAKSRSRALELYNEALQGTPKEDLRIRVEFQLARLLDDSGKKSDAAVFWQKLAKQTNHTKIRTEALLRLAQSLETSSKTLDLATAETYYREALSSCLDKDLCNFVHYRRAWLLRQQNKLGEAIQEIQLSLWDSRGTIQEEVLRDLIVFLAENPGNGADALAILEPIATRLGRPDLLFRLSEGYYSSGNKQAGTAILRIASDRSPKKKYQIRLMEEYYGLRDMDAFRAILGSLEDSFAKQSPEEDLAPDSEKIFRRLVVQLDGERLTRKEFSEDFSRSALAYLELFPAETVTFQIMEAWIQANENLDIKLARTKIWLDDAQTVNRFKISAANQIRLRELRAEIAQKKNDQNLFREEMSVLAKAYSANEKQREARYQIAHSYYNEKNYAQALPIFQELARVEAKSPDKFATLSQNLALDIFNLNGDFSGLTAQADSWLNNPTINKDAKLGAELKEISGIREAAQFEAAVKGGESASSLATFLSFCLAGKALPKSCDNAKTLAVKTRDQESLLKVLEKQGAKEELLNELENSGYFAKAAEALASRTPLNSGKWTSVEAIRIALLFELEGSVIERDRWLSAVLNRARRSKKGFEIDENLLLQTGLEAGLLTNNDLSLGWTPKARARLANQFELAGKTSKETRAALLAFKEEAGSAWAKTVVQELSAMASDASLISFHGANSKSRFEKRLAKVKQVEKFGLTYLEGASRPTRVRILAQIIAAYAKLSEEIMATPMPADLTPEVIAEIQASLAEMAKPFQTQKSSYFSLAEQEIAKMELETERTAFSQALANGSAPPQDNSLSQQASAKGWNYDELKPLLVQLRQDPHAPNTLENLKQFFSDRREARLSGYFEGRIRNLRKGVAQ
jgi:hypothetical protein